MEVDSTVTPGDIYSMLPEEESNEMHSFVSKIMKNVPGIDELMGFVTVFKHVQQMEFECIVFDTAPTGHTLKLLSFPRTMNTLLESLGSLKNNMGGMMDMMTNMMGQNGPSQEGLMSKLGDVKSVVDLVNRQFKDPDLTTFVCVCIPEFLSLFETERLVQELTNYDIDTHNIVVNQVLFPNRESPCELCLAREKMQQKYIDQISTLYEVRSLNLANLGLQNFASLFIIIRRISMSRKCPCFRRRLEERNPCKTFRSICCNHTAADMKL